MKVFYLISISFLLLASCTSEKDNIASKKDLNLLEIPIHIQKTIENIKYLDSTKFAKVNATIQAISKEEFESSNPSTEKQLFEKFCKKSKGYQKGIWEGQNDCSWAVEKNNLEKYGEWANRRNDTLIIKLKNNDVIEFVHDNTNPEQVLYYQFKNYLQKTGFIAIEEIQKGKCRITSLINENDGSIFIIKGKLFFSKDQNAFLAASFHSEVPLHCTNKIELYNLADAQISKIWHIPTGNWGVTDARFISQNDFLLEQSTTGIPAEYKFYLKVSAKN